MNLTTAKPFQTAWQRLTLAVLILAAPGLRAAGDSQPGRFLLVFETSATLKKNLPAIGQTLDVLFSSNLQRELQENDDLAVWTVDRTLHTGTFPLESWTPADAAVYSARVKDFLKHQTYSRHAGLDALQPLLNRVVENSERLTVLIFCDNQSRLLGTPYDHGVNEIITNTIAKNKVTPPPFILVLRSFRGEYLGCSVNRSAPLNFPKFPPPPTVSKPPPTVAPQVANPPAPVAVTPIPALIIVGTNATTNLSALTNPQPPAPRAAAPVVVETNLPVANLPSAAPKIVAAPAANSPPPSNPPGVAARPLPVPQPGIPKTSETPPMAASPAIVTNPPPALASNSSNADVDEIVSETSAHWPIFAGVGALVAAAGLTGWLVMRARRPCGSLITDSMTDDHFPPRK